MLRCHGALLKIGRYFIQVKNLSGRKNLRLRLLLRTMAFCARKTHHIIHLGFILTDMHIRPCKPTDAEAVENLRIASWQAGFSGILPDRFLQGLTGDIERRRTDTVERGKIGVDLVAFIDDELVGWASGGPNRDPDLNPEYCAEMYACYIKPGRWRSGIGRKLVIQALETLEQQRPQKITAWILRDNIRSRELAHSLEFVPDGAERIYDDAGVAVTMVRYARHSRPCLDSA
jgi:L-amino acid N-acyltransferase YncA